MEDPVTSEQKKCQEIELTWPGLSCSVQGGRGLVSAAVTGVGLEALEPTRPQPFPAPGWQPLELEVLGRV